VKNTPQASVVVEVWNWNIVKDEFMGQIKLDLNEYLSAMREGKTYSVTMSLTDKTGLSNPKLTGALAVEIMAQHSLRL
jgi:hypothetical protein